MASAVIHMAVAELVNKELNRKGRNLMIGSIAPDVAKIVGIDRDVTHYVTKLKCNAPNIDLFMEKYHDKLDGDFELGFLIHLITDVLWFDEFLPNYVNGLEITDKTGRKYNLMSKQIDDLIYNDYTNLNAQVLSYYNLDLSLFYERYPFPKSHIDEFKDEYYKPLMDKMSIIMSRTNDYNFVLDITNIIQFINYASKYVLDELKRLQVV